MGVTKILGTGRDKSLLEKVKALAPDRIEVFSVTDNEPIDTWAKSKTNGLGVDVFIDATGPGAKHETMQQGVRALARGGRAVNIGAIMGMVGMDLHTMMDDQQSIEGSAWFTAAEGQDMADMAEAGTLDLSVLEHVCSPLDSVNEAISGIAQRNGGFSNFVIQP
jgi:alcohol dehydrogenase